MALPARNPILWSDSYKTSHYKQMSPFVTDTCFYISSRGGKYNNLMFFGLQIWLYKMIANPITMTHINRAEKVLTAHGLPFNREGWEIIVKEYSGLPPLRIQALPEGTIVDGKVTLVQVSSEDERLAWLPGYYETQILQAVWYPVTVATESWQNRQVIQEFLDLTSDDTFVEFKLHDFGFRGVSSHESAVIGGIAHLVSFQGTDTLAAVDEVEYFYDAFCPGSSIPASEHSTITSWGPMHEREAYENMIDKFGKKGAMFACVSDSYDLMHAIKQYWGTDLKDKIIKCGGTLVIRPDSGKPNLTVLACLEAIGSKFGWVVNTKGYKVLPQCVRLIQGDGINNESLREILETITAAGWATENMAFGMGGGLLQQCNRDTLKMAMKLCAVFKQGKWIDVFKDPKTDPGKRSKGGRRAVYRDEMGKIHDIREDQLKPGMVNLLEDVYRACEIQRFHRFDEIRQRANPSKVLAKAA